MRIGLLGGSFNPAHEGHRHVARLALRRLRLQQVWLLVSPGNPLKSRHGMSPFADRLASARRIAEGRRVVATDIERRLGTRYTVDTLRALNRLFPRVEFVWVMGADILAELPKWRQWREMFHRTAIAAFPRPGYNRRALAGRAALRMRRFHRLARESPVLASMSRPAWLFLPAPQNAISATALRNALYSAPSATIKGPRR